MLIAVIGFSAFLGYAISNGIGVAIFFAIVAGLAVACIIRLVSGWSTFNLLQRIYGAATVVGSSALLVFFVVSVASSPSLANERATRNLRFRLGSDDRFSAATIAYHETKINYVDISGTVANDDDLSALRSEIQRRKFADLHGVRWNVTVRDSGRQLDGWDSELFDQPKL